MKRVCVVGATGQLGFYLGERLQENALLISHKDLDLADTSRISTYLNELKEPIGAVINASAYNLVDKAEVERELCTKINVTAPQELAKWCEHRQIPFVHYSTDYVYSGAGDRPWRESDPAEPLNFYGRSKLLGEQAVLAEMASAVIFRTSWVYSHRRDNFVLTIIKRALQNNEVTVVTDLIGNPTFADGLAAMTLQCMQAENFINGRAGGVYHLSDDIGDASISRFDFAKGILQLASEFAPQLKNMKMNRAVNSDFKAPAARPQNTRLSLDKVKATFGIRPEFWLKNLKVCLERHYANR